MAKCSIIDGLRGWASRTSTNPEMTDAILKAANEIERLRAELKESYGDWATDDTAIREAAGRVLPDLAINGDTWHVPHMTDVCELLVAEVERLRSELQKADNTIARERTESDGLVAALEAEIERLREALNDVLDAIVCPELSTSRMREIRALAQEASE